MVVLIYCKDRFLKGFYIPAKAGISELVIYRILEDFLPRIHEKKHILTVV